MAGDQGISRQAPGAIALQDIETGVFVVLAAILLTMTAVMLIRRDARPQLAAPSAYQPMARRSRWIPTRMRSGGSALKATQSELAKWTGRRQRARRSLGRADLGAGGHSAGPISAPASSA